jgi:hypothetical protein
MPFGIPKGAMCVQRFDDSQNSAIHITYRVLLRSSSMREPRDPLLKVLINFFNQSDNFKKFKSFVIWAVVKQTAKQTTQSKDKFTE